MKIEYITIILIVVIMLETYLILDLNFDKIILKNNLETQRLAHKLCCDEYVKIYPEKDGYCERLADLGKELEDDN